MGDKKMNIEVANRLVEFRKKNGLSQEQLAEKIGVSRQAVSKWERSEASPDTDNLIMLARLYNVSLDELLKTEEDIPIPEKEEPKQEEQPEASGFDNSAEQTENNSGNDKKNEYVHIGLDGIHVEDGKDSVHIGMGGIHVQSKDSDNVDVSHEGVFVNGERVDEKWKKKHRHSIWSSFPYVIVCIIAFLGLGFFAGLWHPGWMVFLTIPLFYGLVEAITKRNMNKFPFAVLTVIVFLCLGFFLGMWHPGWIVFLTIPIYHWIGHEINRHRKENSKVEINFSTDDD